MVRARPHAWTLALTIGAACAIGLAAPRPPARAGGPEAPHPVTPQAATPTAAPAPYAPPATGYEGDPSDERERAAATSAPACISCHEKARPLLVQAWRESAHARKGVGCKECHGGDHSRIFAARGAVSAGTCAACHTEEARTFAASAHARAHDDMVASPRFLDEPPALRAATCNGCHDIGLRDPIDGSVGRCDACHPGHGFSAAAARRPEACASCHSGPEHPQAEAYAASRHGALIAAAGEEAAGAATCASCHMGAAGHDTGALVTDAPGLDALERERRRSAAIASCAPCHATRFAADALKAADGVKREAEALLDRARAVIEALAQDGLLPKATTPTSTATAASASARAGAETSARGHGAAHAHGGAPILGGRQLQHAGSAIERRYFEMWREHGPASWKAAYHQAPGVVRALGAVPLRASLAWIEEEAARLRREAAAQTPVGGR